jgi:periplasmic divalent cation tolerance protein
VDACQVSITAADRDEASVIADSLLDAHLAACVQIIGPIESRYWWQRTREVATEWLCLAKTRAELVDDIVAAVRAVHSYETPEILAVPVVGGDPAYLEWLEAET